ncbi:hypothetical protein PNOK_0827200 [Pyrrhoderma noxium]|uniref:Protein phosphatase 1 regulatory subunit 7 n=1 Tax=Pyrrhoderma noxium TaxID=2282107 RepID=A0A286UAP6_9AGAM|nr:hypothetical protein PNOK_0827200 [Pyrrhoderma noxium]
MADELIEKEKGVVRVGGEQNDRDMNEDAVGGNRDILNGNSPADVEVSEGKKEKKRATLIVQPESEDEGDGDEDEDIDGENPSIEDLLADLPDDTEEIELVHSRLSNLQSLRLPRFGNNLKKLCLRQNNISTLELDVFGPLSGLEELDLYDNKLKAIGNALDGCSRMAVLDFSFNLLRSIPDCLNHFPSLHTIFFVQNKISHISPGSLSSVGRTLRSLELGGNRIRKIENLEDLVNLEELWLGKNKIGKLEGLDNFLKLKILSIQSNRIEKLEGLNNLVDLEELYISHNGIKKLEGLEGNKKLRVLDIGNNFIQKLEGLEQLSCLEEVWASGNQITALTDLKSQLGDKQDLETIYLENNPVQRAEGSAYRRKIGLELPQVKQIDATFVKKF